MAKTEHFWIRATPAWRKRLKQLAKCMKVTEAEAVRRAVEKEWIEWASPKERLAFEVEVEAKD